VKKQFVITINTQYPVFGDLLSVIAVIRGCSYPQLTSAEKKKLKTKQITVHSFQKARQARIGCNMVKSSSPNTVST
jgi:hypothetical protein